MTQLKVNNINMCSTSNPLSTSGLYDTAHKPLGEWQHGHTAYTEHHHHHHCNMQLSQGQEQAATSPTTCDALLHLEDEGSASEEDSLNCGPDEPESGSSRGGGSSSSAGSLCTPPSEIDLEQELELSVGSDQEEPVQAPEGEAQEVVISCTSVDVAQLSLLVKFMHGIQQASGAVLNARPVSPRLFSLCVMGTTSQVQQAVRLVSDVLLGQL